MVKNSLKQIKFDEKKIINELQENARGNIDEISKKYGFSKQKVKRIINKLEENNTIWGYCTVTDYEKLELKEYLILIKKTVKPIEKLANIIISRELEKKAEKLDINIGNSLYLHGYYDWIICFTAKDIKQAMKFNELIKKMYIDYIKETKLHENIFAVKRGGILNPDLKELKDLF